jgi:hypothetical protein
MSTMTAHNLDLSAPPVVKTIGQRSLVVGLLFTALAAATAYWDYGKFMQAYLLGLMMWLGVTLGSMAILMLRHLTKGAWGMVIRRMMGAAMRNIALVTIFFIPIWIEVFLGHRHLYPWLDPTKIAADAHLQWIHDKYLNANGFIARSALYFLIWNLISFFLTKWSREQDSPTAPDHTARFKAVSGPGILLYAFTISFAVIDWVMSIDPGWISTIYGLLVLIGQLLSALCLAIVVERILFRYKPMSELLKPEQVHDHGKFMLTFIMVWAYFSFSQWLIIWSGNLPDEITWYMRRLNNGWGWVGLLLVLGHFCVPFVLLLSRPFKRDVTRLVWLAVWMLLMRWVDLYWIIEPNFSTSFHVTAAEIVVPIAMGGWWLWYFCRNLRAMPLIPAYDPFAKEVLEPEHAHE